MRNAELAVTSFPRTFHSEFRIPNSEFLVGLGRLELPTSRLSGVRSNRLSYRPQSGGDEEI